MVGESEALSVVVWFQHCQELRILDADANKKVSVEIANPLSRRDAPFPASRINIIRPRVITVCSNLRRSVEMQPLYETIPFVRGSGTLRLPWYS